MAKKRKSTRKSKLDSKNIAKGLGAKVITDPKEKKEFEKRYGLPSVFVRLPEEKLKKKSSKKLLDDVEYKKLKQHFLKKVKDGVVPPSIVRQYLSFIEETAQRCINCCKNAVDEPNHGAIHGYNREAWEKENPGPYGPWSREYARWIHNPPLRFCQYCEFNKFTVTLNRTENEVMSVGSALTQYLYHYVEKACKIPTLK